MTSEASPGAAARPPMWLLLLAAFLSGAAALAYQLLWIRELTLLAGSTHAAIACVVSVFFLGLALGNAVVGRLVPRLARPLVAYAGFELAIGVWALLFYLLLGGLDGVYADLYRSMEPGSAGIHALRLAGAVVLLLVPTFCMGATLPLLVQAASLDLSGASRWSAWIYGVNTLGAVAGAFATGFWVIEHYGVSGPMRATAALNLASALCVVPLWNVLRNEPDGKASAPASEGRSRFGTLVIAAFGLLGFCNIAAQILWTRFYALIFNNDTYIFTAILLMFLVGVGLGSLVGERLFRGVKKPGLLFGQLQLVSAAWTIAMIYVVPGLVDTDEKAYVFNNYIWEYFLTVSVGTLPQTLCMGASFPILVRVVMEHHREVGSIVGRALAWNTLGGVFGSAVAGFWFLDDLGLEAGVLIVAGLTALIGIGLCVSSPSFRPASWGPIGALVAIPGALLVVSPLELPESLLALHFAPHPGIRILETKPSVHGTVTITEDANQERLVWINNYWVARETSHLAFGYIPWILHPGPVKSGLGVCFGTGRTFGALLNAGVEELDLVEINPAVVAMSSTWLSRSNHGVTSNPRANIIFDDGRNYIRYADKKYDLITLEPLQMFQKGVVYFYTEDFYREARARMNEGAVLSQWLPYYMLGEREFKSMIKTFLSVFPNALLWSSPSETVLLGYNVDAPHADFDVQEILGRASMPQVGRDLAQSQFAQAYDVFTFTLVDGDGLRRLSEGGTVYTDDVPTLEFTAARNGGEFERNSLLIQANLVPLERVYSFHDAQVGQDITRLRNTLFDFQGNPQVRNQTIQELRQRLAETAKPAR